jgi:hypothetical protein
VWLTKPLFSFESICFRVSVESDLIRLVEFVRNSPLRLVRVLKLVNDLRDSKSLYFVFFKKLWTKLKETIVRDLFYRVESIVKTRIAYNNFTFVFTIRLSVPNFSDNTHVCFSNAVNQYDEKSEKSKLKTLI